MVHELPGVGENLRDHFGPLMKYTINADGVSLAEISRGWKFIREGLRYILFRKGFIAQSMGTGRVFIKTREGLESPDAMLSIIPYIPIMEDGKRRISPVRGISMFAHTQRTESTGSLHIKSANPKAEPAINYNFLDAEYDRETNIRAVRKARELMSTPPLGDIVTEELEPGPAYRRMTKSSITCAITARRPIIRPAPAKWAATQWPSSTKTPGTRPAGSPHCRRLNHADYDFGQYQCSLHDDWRKMRRYDFVASLTQGLKVRRMIGAHNSAYTGSSQGLPPKACSAPIHCFEIFFQGVTFNMACDEYEACAFIRVRPSFQIDRIMEHVLDTMDDKRMSWLLHGIYDTLEAEQVRALGPC